MKTLTLTASLGGSTVPPLGTREFVAGSAVSGITAFPDVGYLFSHWLLDGAEYTDNPITVVMDVDHLLRAIFISEVPSLPGQPAIPAEAVVTVGLFAAFAALSSLAYARIKGWI